MFGSHLSKLKKLLTSEINRAERFQYSIGIMELEVKENISNGVHHLLPGTTLDVEHISSKFRSYDHVEKTAARRYTVMLPNISTFEETEIVRLRTLETAASENWGTVNIGIAVYPFDGENAEEILNKAMKNMQVE